MFAYFTITCRQITSLFTPEIINKGYFKTSVSALSMIAIRFRQKNTVLKIHKQLYCTKKINDTLLAQYSLIKHHYFVLLLPKGNNKSILVEVHIKDTKPT